MIELKRPIVFFDLETTGTDTSESRIVEIACVKIRHNGQKTESHTKINPGIPIPKEASDIHGITDADVKNMPSFKSIAKQLLLFLEDCDLGTFNGNRYDIPLLYSEFKRVGLEWHTRDIKRIDVGNIFKRQNPRTLSAAYLKYTGAELKDAHGALADTLATIEVFENQLDLHEELPTTIEDLDFYCNFDTERLDLHGKLKRDKDGVLVFNFGKKFEKPVIENREYVQWMVNSDFPQDTIEICREELQLLNSSQ